MQARMRFVNPTYPLSELTRDVIAGFYCSYDAFGFGFLESAYRRVLAVELRHAGPAVESEVPFELFRNPKCVAPFRQWCHGRVGGLRGPPVSPVARSRNSR